MKARSIADVSDAMDGALRVLRERFGHEGFLDGQEAVLRSVFSGRNLLVVMPTGSGKSLIYQLPALLADGLTLVVSPLIALMKDQVDELGRLGIAATFVNSSLGPAEQRRRLDECVRGKVRLLYVAPERIRSAAFLDMLRRLTVVRMAVDEAHCISQWGHDFRPDYRRLKEFLQRVGHPAVTALTATATPRVQHDIIESLGLTPEEVDVHVRGFDRPNLILGVRRAADGGEKDKFVLDFLHREPGSGIVYVGTRRAAEELAQKLAQVEPSARPYHAGMEPGERTRAQEAFLAGKARVVVATVAFGMGIDKPDVRFVIHYHLPGSVEAYYQEIGRAGRDGLPSQCVLLYSPADRRLREFFIDLNYPSAKQVESVCDALWAADENPAMMTYREIAGRCEEDVMEGQVGAAIRLLDGAGLTRALAGEPTAAVRVIRPGAAILAELRGPVQRQVFEALSVAADLEKPGWVHVALRQICSAAGLSDEQVRRALARMDTEGHIEYEPPFRGRGVQKLVDRPPSFDKVPIDWKRQRLLRKLEEDKLDAMEQYIFSNECRRGYIVHYFGEKDRLTCDACDRCKSAARHAEKPPDGTLAEDPLVAQAVLVCLRHLSFPLGVSRVVQVVAGSRARQIIEWGLDENPAYGRVSHAHGEVKRVVHRLIEEGYVERQGEATRPVLALTPLGEQTADAADLDVLRQEDGRRPEGPPGTPEAATDEAVRRAALKCVAALRRPVGLHKVAEVLTGSRAKWTGRDGVDGLDVYGSVNAKREAVRQVVEAAVAEGLLEQKPSRFGPVLHLTDAGQEELGRAADEAAPAAEAEAPTTARSRGSAELLDSLLGQLLACGSAEAKRLLEELSFFHPREVADRIAARYGQAASRRERSRAVWAAGELCGDHGLSFLVRCTRSDLTNVRRLAALALGKALSEARARHETMAQVRQALTGLLRDAEAQVRQYAQKALEQLPDDTP
ncbi:RecQ family ATP-dependent DNA helicase [bacterium]|nr:RecQ family ATP-dependent DNA helicase [bacterium]